MIRREPMRKIGAGKETFPGGAKSTRGVYPAGKGVLMRKVNEEVKT
jgi:hypothetical protein